MGQRGLKPLPTKLLHIRGSWKANRRPDEPRPQAAIPPMPAALDAKGRRVWRALTTDLAEVGLLTHLDVHALTRYIQLMQRWQRLHTFITAHGETYEVLRHYTVDAHYDDAGVFVPATRVPYVERTALRPETRAWLGLSDRLGRLEQSFGLTPSGRAAIGILLAAAQSQSEQSRNPKRFLDLG